MEENNNNIIIKGLAIILISILALNVYRTETTKAELATLSDTVNRLQAQIDSLEYPVDQPVVPARAGNSQVEGLENRLTNLASKVATLQSSVERLSKTLSPASSEVDDNHVKGLEKKVNTLESKVGTLQRSVERLSKASSPASSRTSVRTVTSSSESSSTGSGSSGIGRVSVTAKVKVENRYVSGTTYLPNVTTGPTGVVVVNVSMNKIGIVGSVSINNASTITDEEILDLCKEAALKTDFAYNPQAPEKSRGTITYTFTAK